MEDATGLVEPVTVRVNAPEGATLLDLREALSPFQPIDGPLFIDGRPLDDTPLAEVERLHATVVSIGQPPPVSSVAVCGPRIHVETGPVSGMVVPFERDELTFGRSSDNDVVLKDASVSRR